MLILQDKAYRFALRIVKLAEYLHNEKHEYVLSRKALDSGTNVAFLMEEGKQGEGHADFIQKYSVANKEAFKVHLLLRLLRDSKVLSTTESASILSDCGELQALLISSLRTARSRQ